MKHPRQTLSPEFVRIGMDALAAKAANKGHVKEA
jgi:hypothetical protein